MSRPSLRVIGVFFGSLVLFTWGLRIQEVIGFDSRFYLFAQEMWRHGLSWFPSTYHQPYPDYPATSTWLIMMAANWVGMLNKYAAVMPTAVAAAGTVSLTYTLGERQRKHWGWYAACLLLLTAGFVKSARSISLDMLVTLITTACFYCLYEADRLRERVKSRWLYLLLVLGFALRGPIGLVIPTSVVCIYYLVSGRYRSFFMFGLIAAGLLALCSAILLALAWHTGGHVFLLQVFNMEFAGRMNNYFLPVYFYFASSLGNYALAFPLAVLSAAGVLYDAIVNRYRMKVPLFVYQLIGWVLIVMIGMSIPGDKKIRYILPVMPAVALLASYPLIVPGNQRYFGWLRMLMRLLFLFLPGLLLSGVICLPYVITHSVWVSQIHYIPVVLILVVLQLWSLRRWMKYHADASLLLFAALAFMAGYLMVFEPAELYVERARDFVWRVELMRISHRAALVFYREQPDGLPIKYLIDTPEEVQPVFVEKPEALLSLPAAAVIIARVTEFDALPAAIANKFEVIDKDTLGHVNLVVFRRK